MTGVGIANFSKPIQTNKFYANLFLGNQEQSAFPFPFSVRWLKGGNSNIGAFGLGISHVVKDDITFGPGNPAECKDCSY